MNPDKPFNLTLTANEMILVIGLCQAWSYLNATENTIKNDPRFVATANSVIAKIRTAAPDVAQCLDSEVRS